MTPTAPASALGQRYKPHIEEIRAALAVLASLFRPIAPMLMLVFYRLYNTLARLDRLATRWQNNRLRRARKRPTPERKPQAEPKPRTPSGHAWLIRLHQPLAQWAPRIELLVNDPEFIALCAAAPQAGRLLRPLCRMFGITPPAHIHRPPAPRKPRPKKPKAPKPPPFAEHSPNQWPFVPLRLRLRVPGLPISGRRRRKPSG